MLSAKPSGLSTGAFSPTNKLSQLAHPVFSPFPPNLYLRKTSGMTAQTCPQLARVGKKTTAYSPPTISITHSGLEAQHHASRPR